MVRLNLQPPRVLWVDDWTKWLAKLTKLVHAFWPQGEAVIGQDWYHFKCLLLAHAERAHQDFRFLTQDLNTLLHGIRSGVIADPEALCFGVATLYQKYSTPGPTPAWVTPAKDFVRKAPYLLFEKLASVIAGDTEHFDVDLNPVLQVPRATCVLDSAQAKGVRLRRINGPAGY